MSRLGPPLETILATFSQNTFIGNCSFSAAVSLRSGIPRINDQFGGHEGMIATNPSVLQGLDACGTRWNPICEGLTFGLAVSRAEQFGNNRCAPTSSFVRVIIGCRLRGKSGSRRQG